MKFSPMRVAYRLQLLETQLDAVAASLRFLFNASRRREMNEYSEEKLQEWLDEARYFVRYLRESLL